MKELKRKFIFKAKRKTSVMASTLGLLCFFIALLISCVLLLIGLVAVHACTFFKNLVLKPGCLRHEDEKVKVLC